MGFHLPDFRIQTRKTWKNKICVLPSTHHLSILFSSCLGFGLCVCIVDQFYSFPCILSYCLPYLILRSLRSILNCGKRSGDWLVERYDPRSSDCLRMQGVHFVGLIESWSVKIAELVKSVKSYMLVKYFNLLEYLWIDRVLWIFSGCY